MLRKTPPLAAAEAFLAAANARSFRAAAEDLALSPSAFSRRIQMLERFVDAPLFDRSGPTVVLTEKGRLYREAIEPALETIRNATSRMRGDRSEPLRVSSSQSFAVDWLMPRLASLREQCDVEIDLVVSLGVQPLRTGEADLAIVGGKDEPSDFASEEIIQLEAALVAAPHLSNGRPRPALVADLDQHELLAMRTPPHVWKRWLQAVGRPELEPRVSSRFDSSHVMYEAAANGLGVTLATPLASERYLREGRLTPCMTHRHPIGMSYRLVHRTPEAARRVASVRFRNWLSAQAADSAQAFRSATDA